MDIHILDDDESTRILISKIATNHGFSSLTFSCPDEYLSYMNSDNYVVPLICIITDLEMPKKNGYELIAEVRKINPFQRFIVISGSPETDPGNELACFYLTKPVKRDKLTFVFNELKKCVEHGRNKDCEAKESLDDRCAFCINNWQCPRKDWDR